MPIRTLVLALVAAVALHAEASVSLTGVHLCCGGCEKAAIAAVTGAGATATIDKAAGKALKITAADDAALIKAVAALSAAGFSGKPDRAAITLPAVPAAGSAQGVTIAHLHNCCGKCAKAIKGALSGVAGAGEVTLDGDHATVAGTVDPAAVVVALRAAGLDGSVAAK